LLEQDTTTKVTPLRVPNNP
jgi:hypothetical protein